jgi:2-polyprenyl-3-methyl-5-hydroxy-6-metoxy-1,4-benzoquinol methylase
MALICAGHFGCDPGHVELYAVDGPLEYVRCTDCGLIWRSPGSLEISRDYNEDYFESKDYARRRPHKIRKSGWLLDIARSVRPGVRNMLEVGCSLGNTLEAARIRNIGHLGIDISIFAIDYCRSFGLQAELKTMDELLAEGRNFDLIFMQHVLEHFRDPFETVKKCRELLQPGGILLVVVPNANYGQAVKKRGKHRFYSLTGVGAEHYTYFTYQSLNALLENQGFTVVRKNYPVFLQARESLVFFLNRIFRRMLSLLHLDQELIVVAKKNGN